MLPNFNPEEPLPAAEGAVGGEGAGGLDLRHSVHSILGAMRDLLGNIQVGMTSTFVNEFAHQLRL